MKIVIAGAGAVGFHLAQLLCNENQDIVLIDINEDLLEYASSHLDVMTILGDTSSLEVLRMADVGRANLFIGVTTSEQINIIAAILAKKLGARQTIARVLSLDYIIDDTKNFFTELGVDSVISPRRLAALEIERLVNRCSFTDIFEFEKGKLSLAGITINSSSPLVNNKINNIPELELDITLTPIAILRGHKTLIPRGETKILVGDHVYFITTTENIDKLEAFVGSKKLQIKNIMIIGGDGLGYETAMLLENQYNVKLIERDKELCKKLSDKLQKTLIINGDSSDIELMKEEGLSKMDAFLALTPNSETNIIASLTAKNQGVSKTIALVENMEYIHISQNIGVDTLINKKLIAANNIFRFVRKGQIEAITSLHGVEAEIIEYIVHKSNRVTKKPLRELHFPSTALIGGVIRGEETIIPSGDFQLELDDKVIVFALSDSIPKLEKLFH